jgi:hypothetical protein
MLAAKPPERRAGRRAAPDQQRLAADAPVVAGSIDFRAEALMADRCGRLNELVGIVGPLSDRQRDELGALHREMVGSGELSADRRYLVEIDRYPDDYEETTLYWLRTNGAGEVVLEPVRTGSDRSIAVALCRHGTGRDHDGYYFAEGFWSRLIGEEGLHHGREFTSSQVVQAADGAEADSAAADRRRAERARWAAGGRPATSAPGPSERSRPGPRP